jgi:hypothetical protein
LFNYSFYSHPEIAKFQGVTIWSRRDAAVVPHLALALPHPSLGGLRRAPWRPASPSLHLSPISLLLSPSRVAVGALVDLSEGLRSAGSRDAWGRSRGGCGWRRRRRGSTPRRRRRLPAPGGRRVDGQQRGGRWEAGERSHVGRRGVERKILNRFFTAAWDRRVTRFRCMSGWARCGYGWAGMGAMGEKNNSFLAEALSKLRFLLHSPSTLSTSNNI